MRQKLLENQEIKVVYDEPLFFMCKRKHELHELAPKSPVSPSSEPDSIDENYVSPAPRNVKGVNRHCPECIDGVDGNQEQHTCIQKLMNE
jgi:hypothetical protein